MTWVHNVWRLTHLWTSHNLQVAGMLNKPKIQQYSYVFKKEPKKVVEIFKEIISQRILRNISVYGLRWLVDRAKSFYKVQYFFYTFLSLYTQKILSNSVKYCSNTHSTKFLYANWRVFSFFTHKQSWKKNRFFCNTHCIPIWICAILFTTF